MHLNGQVAGSVDNLDQQGKAIALDIAKKVAALIPQLRQRHALEFWIEHGAVAVGVGGDGPAFAGFIRRNVIRICVAHTRATPDLLVEHGLEFDDACHDSPNSLSMGIGSIIRVRFDASAGCLRIGDCQQQSFERDGRPSTRAERSLIVRNRTNGERVDEYGSRFCAGCLNSDKAIRWSGTSVVTGD